MRIARLSPCKINLILNILGKRPDGFHELETIMQPVPIHDELEFARTGTGIALTCNHPELPCDQTNLVHRAAAAFLETARIPDGVKIHLEKRVPMAAGLGGGSGNAGTTLLALNELFGFPLNHEQLTAIAAKLGSDIPFFLQSNPALAEGRGERVTSLVPFPALAHTSLVIVHPGFGISTPWAYKQLARFPKALNGEPGRARQLIDLLRKDSLKDAAAEFYNCLEAPALEKFPILVLYQRFFKERGAAASLMSGSGSSTFAIFQTGEFLQPVIDEFKFQFGETVWAQAVKL